MSELHFLDAAIACIHEMSSTHFPEAGIEGERERERDRVQALVKQCKH